MLNLPAVLRISRRMKYSRPVFVVGPARSGTTLLYRILLQHSVFRVHADDKRFSLAESKVFVHPENLLSRDPDPTRQARAYCLHDSAAFGAFQRQAELLKVWQSLLDTGTGQRLLARFASEAVSRYRMYAQPVLLRLYFHHAARARKSGRILEKTPQHICHIPEILATFPRAKILLLHRHPVDVYSSLRRRLIDESEWLGPDHPSLEWLKIGIEPFCRLYDSNVRQGLRYSRRYGDKILTIHYEKLVKDPALMLQRISKFADVPYDSTCLIPDRSVPVGKTDRKLAQPVSATGKNWSDYLSATQANTIEDYLQPLLDTIGYTRYT